MTFKMTPLVLTDREMVALRRMVAFFYTSGNDIIDAEFPALNAVEWNELAAKFGLDVDRPVHMRLGRTRKP